MVDKNEIALNYKASNSEVQEEEKLRNLIDLLLDIQGVEGNNLNDGSETDKERTKVSPEQAEIDSNVKIDPQKPVWVEAEVIEQVFREKSTQSSDNSCLDKGNKDLIKYPIPLKQHDHHSELGVIHSATSMNQSELSRMRQTIDHLELRLANNEAQMYELTKSVNSLMPLITELLRLKYNDASESILKTIVPVIDEVIEQKTSEDSQKMGAAIAPSLPSAISKEVHDCPKEIARAIAPEIASAIEEQIRLDSESISNTLGPEMGKAIKTQIEVERDAMVDALYPVIGNTISKYMVEAIAEINDKVENALSIEGVKRKIRAKIQGVSEAELILREAIGYKVQAIFLIHKASGLLIREVQPSEGQTMESSMLAGMLTAIRSFANDCLASDGVSELNEIEYDDSKIILEVAGYCYLAVVVQGEPSKSLIEKIRHTLGKIVLDYDREIQEFDGDPATIPEEVQPLLEALTDTEIPEKTSKPPYTLLLLLFLFVILPWGYFQYRSSVARRIEARTTVALDAAPELSVYRLIPDVDGDKLTLTGRVPNEYLRDRAAVVAREVAGDLELDNQIIAVDVPQDPLLAAAEVQRVSALFNDRSGIKISTRYEENTVTIEGTVRDKTELAQIIQAFKNIPGVDSLVSIVGLSIPDLNTRIYFESGSSTLQSTDIYSKVKSIAQFLRQYPGVHLKIIGHADARGGRSSNQSLAIARAASVRQALLAAGINPARLEVSAGVGFPPDVTEEQPLWLSRCVWFETFIPLSQE